MDRSSVRLHPDRLSSSLSDTKEIQSAPIGCCRGIEHDSDARDTGCYLLEQLKPLSRYRRLKNTESSDVAAGLCHVVDEAVTEWIGHSHEHYRDGAGLAHQGSHGGGGNGQNSIGLEGNQLSRECSNAIDFTIPPAIHDPSVAARPPEPLESLPERANLRLCVGVDLGEPRQHSNPPHPFRLLRPRRERPRRRAAAEQRQEFPPSHALNSSSLDPGVSLQHAQPAAEWPASPWGRSELS